MREPLVLVLDDEVLIAMDLGLALTDAGFMVAVGRCPTVASPTRLGFRGDGGSVMELVR